MCIFVRILVKDQPQLRFTRIPHLSFSLPTILLRWVLVAGFTCVTGCWVRHPRVPMHVGCLPVLRGGQAITGTTTGLRLELGVRVWRLGGR